MSYNLFDCQVYYRTQQWITLSSIRGLAPFSCQDKSCYPEWICLDRQLECEYTPTRGGQGYDAFFEAIRQWRPNRYIGALRIDSSFRLECILDPEDNYRETRLYLTGDKVSSCLPPRSFDIARALLDYYRHHYSDYDMPLERGLGERDAP